MFRKMLPRICFGLKIVNCAFLVKVLSQFFPFPNYAYWNRLNYIEQLIITLCLRFLIEIRKNFSFIQFDMPMNDDDYLI